MPDIRELKDQASKHFSKGKFEKAASAYEELCRLEPRDMQLRVRLGDARVKLGDKPAAVGAYRIAAESYAKEGFLPRAIAVCKLILEVDPHHVETQGVLAQLYAKKTGGPRVAPASAPRPTAAAGAGARPAARAWVLVPEPPAAALPNVLDPNAPLELETGPRTFAAGVGPAAPADDAAREPSGLELDKDVGAKASWKGAMTWEAPASAPPAPPAPASAPPAAQPAAAPAPRLVASAVVELSLEDAPADDVLFVGGAEPEPPPAAPAPISIKDIDLGEPELLGLRGPGAPAPAAPPPRPAPEETWAEPEGVADSLAAALEGAAQAPVTPAAPAAAQGWFAEPEGTREESGRHAPTLAELAIASVDEDEEIEILTVSVDRPVDAAALPEIPLFSDLSREAFIELASQCTLRRCTPGEVVIEQGTIGTSFFVVTSGAVKVVKQVEGREVTLARICEGSFFGEMALISGSPRLASVVAEDDTECLEISAALLSSLLQRYPHVGQALKKFCRQRLLNNIMTTSALFRPFDKNDRKELIEKFKAREIGAGEAILTEGQPADGLYVLMAGEAEVRKRKDGVEAPLATLREGDVFGEISLLTKSAATATVAATRRSTILRLPRAAFDEVISTHPQILMLVSELSDERLRAQQSFGQDLVGSDGLLLL